MTSTVNWAEVGSGRHNNTTIRMVIAMAITRSGGCSQRKLKYWGVGGRSVEFPTLFFKLKISHVIVWEVALSS